MTDSDLARVKRAASRVRRAREEYRRTLVDAHEAGASVQSIARAAGVTRQAVYAILERFKSQAPR